MISTQSFEPSRGRVAKVLVQKLLRAVEAEKRGLKNRVWPHLGFQEVFRHCQGMSGCLQGVFPRPVCVFPFSALPTFGFVPAEAQLLSGTENQERKNQPKEEVFGTDLPADIRPKTSIRTSKSWKKKHFGTDIPRGRERKISPKRKFLGRISRGHPGVIRADIPAQNFGQGGPNPGKKQAFRRGHP